MKELIIIAVMSVMTMLIRFSPFILFSRGTPKVIIYLGEVLPNAVMAMLLVYCLKGISFVKSPHGFPEIIAVAIVVVLHKLKHNTLISILGGTICYMVLLRIVG